MGTPFLTQFDWIVINSSAGKDSQAMLDAVVAQAKAEGVPLDRLLVVHADLGRAEWEGTRELAQRQAEHYGLRFEVVRREVNDLLDHVEARGAWPGPATRYCTSDHKRAPIGKLLTRLTQEAWERDGWDEVPRKDRPKVRILNCLGLRAQESPGRAKQAAFEKNDRASCSFRSVYDWLPVHAWKVEDVWARIRASGVPYHPAYDLGMPRLSCVFCIYAPKATLMLAGKHNRALLDEYVAVEERIGHKFKADLSIREVRDALDAGEVIDNSADSGAWGM